MRVVGGVLVPGLMMKTRAAAAAVLCVTLVGCASQTAEVEGTAEASPGHSPDLLAPLSPEVEAQVAEVRREFEWWAGSVSDHQAAAVVAAHWYNGPEDECAKSAGVPFEGWAGWEAGIQGREYPQWYTHGAVTPPVRFVSFSDEVNAAADRLVSLVRTDPPEEYAAALDACSLEGDEGPEDDLANYTHPAVVAELDEAWRDTVGAVADEFGTDSELRACASESPLSGPYADAPGVNAWFNILEDLSEEVAYAPLPGEEPSAQWSAYRDAEELLLVALWECHDDTFDTVMHQMVTASDDFAATHGEQIEEAHAAWARTRDAAGELGWTPDRPLAGFPLDELPRR